jgi:hypothetical protein
MAEYELALPQVPEARPDDPEDVSWSLSTAEAMWARGDHLEGIKWVRKAAEAASEVEDDARALALAKAASDLATIVARHSRASMGAGAMAEGGFAPPEANFAAEVRGHPVSSRPTSAQPVSSKPTSGQPVSSIPTAARSHGPPAPSYPMRSAPPSPLATRSPPPIPVPSKASQPPRTSSLPPGRFVPHLQPRREKSAEGRDASPTQNLIGDETDRHLSVDGDRPTTTFAASGPPMAPPVAPSPLRAPQAAVHDPGIQTTQAVRVVVWRDANGVHVAPAGTVVSAIKIDAVLVVLEQGADLTAWLSQRER